jgi:hypothetical protein
MFALWVSALGSLHPRSMEGPMRRIAFLFSTVAVLAGCAKKDQSASVALADVAGTWSMRTMSENSDSTLVTYEMTATGDNAGWIINFPGRDPVPVRVVLVEGDSIVTEAGPFESVLRQGIQVSTRSVFRKSGDKLVGNVVATYASGTGDPVVRLRSEGTRAP